MGSPWKGGPEGSASLTSPEVQPPQNLGAVLLLCSGCQEDRPGLCPLPPVLDLRRTHSQCGNCMQMIVPHTTSTQPHRVPRGQLWPASLLQSCRGHCGKQTNKKSLLWTFGLSFLSPDHPSSLPSPFWKNPFCAVLVVGGNNPLPFLPLTQEWVWDLLLSSSKSDTGGGWSSCSRHGKCNLRTGTCPSGPYCLPS